MKISDVIYGEDDIKEPVLVELINSPSLQRLKKIAQYGVPRKLYHLPGFSRYEHSIGVVLLLRKLGASLEEQIAGLLHDVSHSAFSHVIDWVIGDIETKNYQDTVHKKFISESEIPAIITKYGVNTDLIIENKKFGLLEREASELCADRVDYTLKELFHTWGERKAIKICAENLVNHQGRVVFRNKEAASLFGGLYLRCQREHWAGRETVIRYHLFSNLLKTCLAKGILETQDFYKDDESVMQKVLNSNNKEIVSKLELLKRKDIATINSENGSTLTLRKKFRYIDPCYLDKGEVIRLSEADEHYRNLLKEARQHNQAGITFTEL